MKLHALGFSLAILFTGSVAYAQPTPADPVEEHLRRGVDLRRSGQDDAALTEFEAAYALRREPRTAAQLGLACQVGGRWERAETLLRDALAAPGDPWVARNRAALEGARDVVARHLATVELVSDVAGARVRVNGADVGTLPLAAPLRVLAGTVVLEVTAEGYEPLTLRFVAGAGETLRERARLVAVPPPAQTTTPAPTPPPEAPPRVITQTRVVLRESPTPWRAAAIGSFAFAAASIAAGVTTLAVGESQATAYNERCDPGDARGECGALRDDVASLRAVTWVLLPVGAVFAAAGALLFVRSASTARAATAARCDVGVASVQCGVTF